MVSGGLAQSQTTPICYEADRAALLGFKARILRTPRRLSLQGLVGTAVVEVGRVLSVIQLQGGLLG